MSTFDGICVTDCERCPALVDSRTQIVNGVGPEDADILFIGEGPGANEDAQGEPFVGRSGTVLTDALIDAGVLRDEVRITNCVRCRPPENRDPQTEELSNCREYLDGEIQTVDPELIVTLGKVPSQHVLGRSVAVTKEAGSFVDVRIGEQTYPLLISVHPAATLYDRSQRKTFTETITKAVEIAQSTTSEQTGNGQSRLGEF
ncbi:uracil-DNA glycosylase [Natronocalculus amylovorans]|uniref:Type-4 uracil-DNA glycosylase n=1 Tax=Natronocalculus amylovorans TaxID=2917812 RepID=A0AAE3K7S1_9EURY|nr:uracil-DNA glycosylase [Natronocalculus amylovorans]MCL9815755.1 uracil-DNA glycosylase [Natronocalculus amylovorans]